AMGSTEIPMIGASGGVFGVLAYYMVRSPRAKVGILHLMFFRPIWIRFSAKWVLLMKVAQEFVLLWIVKGTQLTGIAHAAHIGGAVFGLLAALVVKYRSDS